MRNIYKDSLCEKNKQNPPIHHILREGLTDEWSDMERKGQLVASIVTVTTLVENGL